MVDVSWSQLLDTPIGRAAEIIHVSDRQRVYHDWTHIRRCYYHAKHTYGFAYDVNLDLAIMFHDCVYDALPDKELRSIELFLDVYEAHGPVPGADPDKVVELIRSTIDHRFCDDNRMIFCDLGDMSDTKQVDINYKLIEEESFKLYGVDHYDYAIATHQFMEGMLERIEESRDQAPANEIEHWENIIPGIVWILRRAAAHISY